MTYRSMLVNFDIDGPVEPIARLAIDLARRCNASLIGFCAADAPLPAITAPECGSHALEIWEQTKDEIKRKLNELRREFEDLVGGSVESSWHEAIDSPTRSLFNSFRAGRPCYHEHYARRAKRQRLPCRRPR